MGGARGKGRCWRAPAGRAREGDRAARAEGGELGATWTGRSPGGRWEVWAAGQAALGFVDLEGWEGPAWAGQLLTGWVCHIGKALQQDLRGIRSPNTNPSNDQRTGAVARLP